MTLAKPIAPRFYVIPKNGTIRDFGFRRYQRPNGTWHYHQGCDMSAPIGTALYAIADYEVTHAHGGNGPARGFDGYGRIAVLYFPRLGIFALYAHCDSVLVTVGQKGKQGDKIATVGDTAFKAGAPAHRCGPHLHFELAATKYPKPRDTKPADWGRIDPSTWLPENVE